MQKKLIIPKKNVNNNGERFSASTKILLEQDARLKN